MPSVSAMSARKLVERSRSLSAQELAEVPWLRNLSVDEQERAASDMRVVQVDAGELLCRVGRPLS